MQLFSKIGYAPLHKYNCSFYIREDGELSSIETDLDYGRGGGLDFLTEGSLKSKGLISLEISEKRYVLYCKGKIAEKVYDLILLDPEEDENKVISKKGAHVFCEKNNKNFSCRLIIPLR